MKHDIVLYYILIHFVNNMVTQRSICIVHMHHSLYVLIVKCSVLYDAVQPWGLKLRLIHVAYARDKCMLSALYAASVVMYQRIQRSHCACTYRRTHIVVLQLPLHANADASTDVFTDVYTLANTNKQRRCANGYAQRSWSERQVYRCCQSFC